MEMVEERLTEEQIEQIIALFKAAGAPSAADGEAEAEDGGAAMAEDEDEDEDAGGD